MLHSCLFGLIPLLALACVAAAEPQTLPVWPDGDPGSKDMPDKEHPDPKRVAKTAKPDRFIQQVTHAALTVYLPEGAKASTSAVVICPGGGYGGLAIDKEGHDIARWLNSVGVAGVVLKYRMPRPDLSGDAKPWPLQDAQRAIRIVRSKSKDWNIDPARVGIMGFSAGGHLASTAGTHFDAGDAKAADPLDRLSCRPDFLILVYPVVCFNPPIAHLGSRNNLLGKNPDPKLVELYSNELQVTPQTPPTMLVHARDDGVKVENSIRFHEALKKAGVPAELFLFDKGGHGYGLGVNGGEAATWPARCAQWMSQQKLRLDP